MKDEIREIPAMSKNVSESRQQIHNLVYQLKFVIEDGFSENVKQHRELLNEVDNVKKHNAKQDRGIVYGRLALFIGVLSLCSIVYLHSGPQLSIAVGGVSSILGLLAKIKGIL